MSAKPFRDWVVANWPTLLLIVGGFLLIKVELPGTRLANLQAQVTRHDSLLARQAEFNRSLARFNCRQSRDDAELAGFDCSGLVGPRPPSGGR